MSEKSVLRRLKSSDRANVEKREQAREDVRRIKESVLFDKKQADAEIDLPELDGLVTRQHLRHARMVIAAGKGMGETVERLPIHSGDKPYHQKNHRQPKSLEFEAQLLTLVERYGPEEAVEHFSQGQHQKYQLKIKNDGTMEVWNVKTHEREYPPLTTKERLKKLLSQ